MSELNGTLRDFPLRQVLKLVETGRKSGILVVTGESMRGSVFFRDGRLIFATTRSGPGETDASATERRSPTDADHRRLLASVIMRLLRLSDGSFVFQSGVEPMHPTTGEVTVTEVLEAAEDLLATWDRVESVLGSMRQAYAARPVTDPADVHLTPEEWNVVASLGDGRSAAQVAMTVGMSEYAAATAMARLIDRKLLARVERPATAEPPDHSEPMDEQAAPTRAEQPEAIPEAVGEPTLAKRYEFYVNSRGSELREPPRPEPAVVLDLTQDGSATLEVHEPVSEDETEPEPASELARRWRDLRRGKLPIDDE